MDRINILRNFGNVAEQIQEHDIDENRQIKKTFHI